MKNLIIDFDSTFVKVEALDMLARIALEKNPDREKIVKEIETITALGMEGKLSFPISLKKRLQLFAPNKEDIQTLINFLKKNITKSILENKNFFGENYKNIYIISGGFLDYIYPVAKDFGIKRENILANEFLFNKDGVVTGFNKDNFLAKENGKILAVKSLNLQDATVIGDGYTDYVVKEAKAAQQFFAFTENVKREAVIKKADRVIKDFNEVLEYIESPKALLLENIEKGAEKIFREEGYGIENIPHALAEEELIEKIKDIEILGIRSKTKITRRVLENAPKLRAVGAYCIGTNQIDLDACREFGVSVFNDPFSNGRSVVELVIGEMIMLARGVVGKTLKLKSGQWEKSAKNSFEIRDKSLGIIGYGNIGSEVGLIAQTLGTRVYFYDVLDKKPLGNAQKCRSMEEVLEIADIITIHVDGAKSNTNLISDKEFSQMKEGVILLNLSRGHVVDLKALEKNMESGKILGAGIDVYPEEPEKNGEFISGLSKFENVILTPHIGGSTIEAQAKIAKFVSERILKSL